MTNSTRDDAAVLLKRLFLTAVAAADPGATLRQALLNERRRPAIVLALGKAAPAMAHALEDSWDAPLSGLVVAPQGAMFESNSLDVIGASHPIPDHMSVLAGERMLALARTAPKERLVVVLLSGGASALAAAPIDGVSLDEKARLTEKLIRSGASITEINRVRTCLSRIKGGGLRRARGDGPLSTYVVSDVPGNDPAIVGSGPTIAVPSPLDAAWETLSRHDLHTPHLRAAMERAARKTNPARIAAPTVLRTIVTAKAALTAAAQEARCKGWKCVDFGDALEGEATQVATWMAAQIDRHWKPGERVILLSGGELTVTHGGGGIGGPNQEFALALALALRGRTGVHAIACDTDGVDGALHPDGPVAGALVGPHTLDKARALGIDAATLLARHQSGEFFRQLGDRVLTGPTGTNVNDFRAILILP